METRCVPERQFVQNLACHAWCLLRSSGGCLPSLTTMLRLWSKDTNWLKAVNLAVKPTCTNPRTQNLRNQLVMPVATEHKACPTQSHIALLPAMRRLLVAVGRSPASPLGLIQTCSTTDCVFPSWIVMPSTTREMGVIRAAIHSQHCGLGVCICDCQNRTFDGRIQCPRVDNAH